MQTQPSTETVETEAAPLHARVGRRDGQLRRCVRCRRILVLKGSAEGADRGGALANWCRACNPQRTTRPVIDTLRWCGIERSDPVATDRPPRRQRIPLPAVIGHATPTVPPRTTLRERLQERRAAS